MVGVYFAIALFGAVLMGLCLSNPKSDHKNIDMKGVVFSTIIQFKDKRQLLLIPISIYCGWEQTFFVADFSKASDFSDFSAFLSTR